ncbi:hypothetical protein, partial [Peribacillus sp. N1]
RSSSKYHFSFILESTQSESCNIKVIYKKKQLSEFDVRILTDRFFNVFKSVIVNYNQNISDLELLLEEEKNQLLKVF